MSHIQLLSVGCIQTNEEGFEVCPSVQCVFSISKACDSLSEQKYELVRRLTDRRR